LAHPPKYAPPHALADTCALEHFNISYDLLSS
jgi:hypothetical protein